MTVGGYEDALCVFVFWPVISRHVVIVVAFFCKFFFSLLFFFCLFWLIIHSFGLHSFRFFFLPLFCFLIVIVFLLGCSFFPHSSLAVVPLFITFGKTVMQRGLQICKSEAAFARRCCYACARRWIVCSHFLFAMFTRLSLSLWLNPIGFEYFSLFSLWKRSNFALFNCRLFYSF